MTQTDCGDCCRTLRRMTYGPLAPTEAVVIVSRFWLEKRVPKTESLPLLMIGTKNKAKAIAAEPKSSVRRKAPYPVSPKASLRSSRIKSHSLSASLMAPTRANTIETARPDSLPDTKMACGLKRLINADRSFAKKRS